MSKREYRRASISFPEPGGEIFCKFTDGKAVELIFMARDVYGINVAAESDERKAMFQALYDLKPITATHRGVEFTLTPSVCAHQDYENEICKVIVRSRMKKAKASRVAA